MLTTRCHSGVRSATSRRGVGRCTARLRIHLLEERGGGERLVAGGRDELQEVWRRVQPVLELVEACGTWTGGLTRGRVRAIAGGRCDTWTSVATLVARG